MSDGITLPGNGAVTATDDAGAAGHVQIIKLAVSADGSATPITADSDGLLVNLGANNDVTVSGVSTATLQGALTETAPTTDTASSGLNGRLQRIAQRLTSLIALLPSALGAGGGLKVDGSGTALPVSGTVTANAGTGPFPVSDNSGSLTVDAPVATPVFVRLSDGTSAIATLPVSLASVPSHAVTNAGTFAVQVSSAIPAGTNNIGDVDVVTLPNVTLAAGTNTNEVVGDVAEDAALAGNPIRMGLRASTAIPTAMSADNDVVTPWADLNGAQVVKPRPAATGTLANVSGSASSVTLISSNTSRLGAIIVNDSAAILYLKYGSTASSTSFTYKLQPGMAWEMPAGVIYTGVITGIWASATGSARVTELT